MSFFKGRKWSYTGCLDYSPYRKSTAATSVLSSSSCHHPSVHASWPISVKSHMRMLSSSKRGLKVAVEQLVQRIMKCDIDHPAIPALQCFLRGSGRQVHGAAREQEKTAWLVLPYSSAFKKAAFARICKQYSMYFESFRLSYDDQTYNMLKTRIGYRLSGNPLALLLAKSTRFESGV